MIVYRLSQVKYPPLAHDLLAPEKVLLNMMELAEGARRYGRRWNETNIPAVYCSEHLSLCTLEILVHIGDVELIPDYRVIEIEIPDKLIVKPKLAAGWERDQALSRAIFTEHVQKGDLAIQVPSVIIPSEHNIVINPVSNHILKVRVRNTYDFDFDKRLFEY